MAWLLKFCFYVGFTIGWTMLTAVLVNRLGLEYLPLLYVANALLTIGSTMIFAAVLHRIGRQTMIITTVVSGAVLLIGSIATLTVTGNVLLFLGVALLAEALFFGQLNILLGLFIEEIFSPLESERTFPLIETSEYIGAIAGGLTILTALKFGHVAPTTLTFFWAGAIASIVPLILYFTSRERKLPKLKLKTSKDAMSGIEHLSEGAMHIRNTPFLIGLLIVVMLQWMCFTLVNFQYTKAVDHGVGQHATADALHNSGEATLMHEDRLTEGLGALHIGFGLLALTTQLFLTSRVLTRLGIVRTLRLHPIMTLITATALTFKFGFMTAVANKALFEVTTGMYTASYHASFYALKENVREHAKELLEGLVRPLGVIAGTGLLFAITTILSGTLGTLGVSIAIICLALTMIGLLTLLRTTYTHVSKKNLELFGDHPAKFTSIEVLAQAGHANSAEILVKNLLYRKESELMQIKILESLGRIREPKTIPEIIACFGSKSLAVKIAAVQALGEFKDLGAHFFTQSFTRYRVITALKELFANEDSKELRSAIVHVFANMHQAEVIPFLVDTLSTTDETVRADCIYVCGLFHDVSAAYYLEPYLNAENPFVKANAIISLWQFPQYRLKLTMQLTNLLESDNKETQKATIHALGEIKAIQERPRLLKYLEHPDPELQLLAALALAKLMDERAINIITDFVLGDDLTLAAFAKRHMRHIPAEMQKEIENAMHQRLGKKLQEILEVHGATHLGELPTDTLMTLKTIYAHTNDWHEVAKIDSILTGKTLN